VFLEESFEVEDCASKICIFKLRLSLSNAPDQELEQAILELASLCQKGSGKACVCILPREVSDFSVNVPEHLRATLSALPLGVMGINDGRKLAKHMEHLKRLRCADAADGIPEELRGWEERREAATSETGYAQQEGSSPKVYYHHVATGRKRSSAPPVDTGAKAALVTVKEDCFLQWLKDVLATQPKGIIISQTSFRPDPELLSLPESMFNLDTLDTPIAMVSFEVGEELRNKASNGHEPWVTLEFQQTGAVYAWGNGSNGQLGLAGIENRTFLQISENALTKEENAFADRPCYVAHLHEHEVTEIACGAAHTVGVTASGEAFSWGTADALGLTPGTLTPVGEPCAGVPVIVSQFEGLAKAIKPFAGHLHTFVLATLTAAYKSIV